MAICCNRLRNRGKPRLTQFSEVGKDQVNNAVERISSQLQRWRETIRLSPAPAQPSGDCMSLWQPKHIQVIKAHSAGCTQSGAFSISAANRVLRQSDGHLQLCWVPPQLRSQRDAPSLQHSNGPSRPWLSPVVCTLVSSHISDQRLCRLRSTGALHFADVFLLNLLAREETL